LGGERGLAGVIESARYVPCVRTGLLLLVRSSDWARFVSERGFDAHEVGGELAVLPRLRGAMRTVSGEAGLAGVIERVQGAYLASERVCCSLTAIVEPSPTL